MSVSTTQLRVKPLFQDYHCPADYKEDNIKFVIPMTAKEEDREVELNKMLHSEDFLAEEKLDGTRATLHITRSFCRVFSRRVSVKTKWFVENTDSLPHIRDTLCSDFEGTVIDGELTIANRPFIDCSSTMNCDYEKAIQRQQELGFVQLNAFDIIYYKGVYVALLPLFKRKVLLKRVIEALNNSYILELKSFTKDILVPLKSIDIITEYNDQSLKINSPDLYECILQSTREVFLTSQAKNFGIILTKKAYYQYIINTGGEGIIL